MYSFHRRILCCFFLLQAVIGDAQNFGGFPPSVHWKQINSDTARIIFSPAAQQQAQRIAQLVHAMAADTPVAVGNKLKKINIVLHSNTTQANGYVALGPFRSEYYLVPGAAIFDFGNLPWHENLAVHEYRHVQQYNNFNHGLTKIFSLFGGQNGRALANALTVPDWFFEGDAVYAETAFTGLGRGRQPLFLSAYNSLWQEGKQYRWMKLRNGSYKDYVPNHYPLGYLLVNYGYLKYGADFWQHVTRDASGFKGLFYPFQRAVKKYGGADFKTFRNEAFQFYKKEVPKKAVFTNDKTVTNYYYPQPIGADSMIYVKESYKTVPAFYIQDKGGEHRLERRYITTENWFRYAAGKIVYTAYNTDSRWSLTDYSDIILLDVATKKEKQVTKHDKYYTPDLSPDATQLIAVSINDSLQTELHLINTANGGVLKKFRSYKGDYFAHPKFLDATHIVVGVRAPSGLLSLQLLNLTDGSSEVLIQPQKSALGDFFIFQNTIYFTASFNGNDDIYAYRLAEKKLYQLTSGKTGNYNPAVFKDSLVWSKFTTKGLQLQQQALTDLLWQEVALDSSEKETAQFHVATASTNLLTTPARSFAIKNYPKSTGLINVHSWDPGVTLYSNNILNTLATSLYYHYNEAEKSHTTGITAMYGGLFPVLSAHFQNTFNRHIKTEDSARITANESEAAFGYNIPLNFTKGKTFKTLNFGSNYVYKTFRPTGASKNIISENTAQYLHHFIAWNQQAQRARQQIFPRLGYAASLQYRHRIDGRGYQASAGTAVYLPTFSKTHALVLTGSLQQVDTGNVLFSNRFLLARGYPDYYYARMWNAGVNYHMPLLYPDWGFANLFYLMRLRSNFFFDYSQVRSKTNKTAALCSTGAELYFDTKWWNQLPVTFGVRYSYLLDKAFAPSSRHVFEFVVPVDLIPF